MVLHLFHCRRHASPSVSRREREKFSLLDRRHASVLLVAGPAPLGKGQNKSVDFQSPEWRQCRFTPVIFAWREATHNFETYYNYIMKHIIPLAVVATAVLALVACDNKTADAIKEKSDDAKEAVANKAEEVKDAAGKKIDEASEAAKEAVPAAAAAVDSAAEQAKDATQNAVDATKDAADKAVDKVQDAAGNAMDSAKDAVAPAAAPAESTAPTP